MNRVLMFSLFFSVVLSAFGLMQYRLYRLYRRWVRNSFDRPSQSQWLKRAKVILLLSNIHFLSRFFLSDLGIHEHPLSQVFMVYPGGMFFAIIIFSFLIVSARDLLAFLRWLAKTVARRMGHITDSSSREIAVMDAGRRRFLRLSGMSVASVIGSIPVVASAATARDYQIHRVPLHFDNLPSALNGFTIAQVSDIHAGLYMTEKNMREIFELTNSLQAAMIMVTGDFVDNTDSQILPLYKAIEMLRAAYGIFGCLGNHDHFATAEKVAAAMRGRNIEMLNNSHRTLSVNGAQLSIIGIDDAGRGKSNFADLGRALDGLNHDSFKVMLTHRPDVFPQCVKLGMDLTLAGHTHGGQVGFQLGPLNLNPVYLIHKYAMGHYVEGGKHLYVNVGVGMVGVPIRMVKPEISLFTLHPSR